ncbi:MAG: hypothetical protein ICV73_19440 [Acetobacteraceae bacterium]|nr:hypothetical protein [Acetobacteraceae bacterium]
MAWHPAAFHGLDVAAVAQVWLEAHPDAAAPSARAGGWETAAWMRAVPFLVALHDAGKFSRAFQAKAPDHWPAVLGAPDAADPGHDTTGFALLADPDTASAALDRVFGTWKPWQRDPLLRAVTSHHGRPPAAGAPVGHGRRGAGDRRRGRTGRHTERAPGRHLSEPVREVQQSGGVGRVGHGSACGLPSNLATNVRGTRPGRRQFRLREVAARRFDVLGVHVGDLRVAGLDHHEPPCAAMDGVLPDEGPVIPLRRPRSGREHEAGVPLRREAAAHRFDVIRDELRLDQRARGLAGPGGRGGAVDQEPAGFLRPARGRVVRPRGDGDSEGCCEHQDECPHRLGPARECRRRNAAPVRTATRRKARHAWPPSAHRSSVTSSHPGQQVHHRRQHGQRRRGQEEHAHPETEEAPVRLRDRRRGQGDRQQRHQRFRFRRGHADAPPSPDRHDPGLHVQERDEHGQYRQDQEGHARSGGDGAFARLHHHPQDEKRRGHQHQPFRRGHAEASPILRQNGRRSCHLGTSDACALAHALHKAKGSVAPQPPWCGKGKPPRSIPARRQAA